MVLQYGDIADSALIQIFHAENIVILKAYAFDILSMGSYLRQINLIAAKVLARKRGQATIKILSYTHVSFIYVSGGFSAFYDKRLPTEHAVILLISDGIHGWAY